MLAVTEIKISAGILSNLFTFHCSIFSLDVTLCHNYLLTIMFIVLFIFLYLVSNTMIIGNVSIDFISTTLLMGITGCLKVKCKE